MAKRNRTVGRKRSPKGFYANYFEIGRTAFEVVIDFGQSYAGHEPTACHTRIVTSPVYAKALLQTLEGALNSQHDAPFSKGRKRPI